GVIYAAQSDRLYRTTDGGESWTPVAAASATGHTLAVPQGRPHRIFIGTNGSVARSDDDGATWNASVMGVNPTTRVVTSPGRPDTIYVLNGFLRTVSQAAPLYVSTDAGQS